MPLTTKTAIGFNPHQHLCFFSLFCLFRGRGHSRLLSSISEAHPSRLDGSVSPGSSHWEVKRRCAEGYFPSLFRSLLVHIVFWIFQKKPARRVYILFANKKENQRDQWGKNQQASLFVLSIPQCFQTSFKIYSNEICLFLVGSAVKNCARPQPEWLWLEPFMDHIDQQ